jgi:hypothetical protein
MTLTTRLAIAMIALVAAAVSAVGWLSYRSLEQALLPRVLDRIETNSRLVATNLESHVRSAPGDIATFRGLAAVTGLMRARINGGRDPVDNTTEALWRERLGNRLAAQMAIKPAHSLRFIGVEDDHREILRADRSGPNGTVRVVPEAELKRVGDAPYFRDTIKLAADETYVSPIHLSEENGAIRRRRFPSCRSRCRSSRPTRRMGSSSSYRHAAGAGPGSAHRCGRAKQPIWSTAMATI